MDDADCFVRVSGYLFEQRFEFEWILARRVVQDAKQRQRTHFGHSLAVCKYQLGGEVSRHVRSLRGGESEPGAGGSREAGVAVVPLGIPEACNSRRLASGRGMM